MIDDMLPDDLQLAQQIDYLCLKFEDSISHEVTPLDCARRIRQLLEQNPRLRSSSLINELVRIGLAKFPNKERRNFNRYLVAELPELDGYIKFVDAYCGAQVGSYTVKDLIGKGNFGTVYRTEDSEGRTKAIKFIPTSRMGSQLQAHFANEVRVLQRLKHDSIIQLLDYGVAPSEDVFIVTPLHDSGSLRDRLATGAIGLNHALKLAIRICETLTYAHSGGVIHRDIKPSNILLTDSGAPVICDFGLSILEDFRGRQNDEIAGSPVYMSPEQARGQAQHIDARTDIWSVGVLLFELVVGRRPRISLVGLEETELAVLPRKLQPIIAKCLELNPIDRYPTCLKLTEDLKQLLQPNRRLLLGIAAAAAGLLLAAVAYASSNNKPKFDIRHIAQVAGRLDQIGLEIWINNRLIESDSTLELAAADKFILEVQPSQDCRIYVCSLEMNGKKNWLIQSAPGLLNSLLAGRRNLVLETSVSAADEKEHLLVICSTERLSDELLAEFQFTAVDSCQTYEGMIRGIYKPNGKVAARLIPYLVTETSRAPK